ncbi:hypothetical protein Bbelb_269170 [Branchiostoma belcheri]|nr:hypothetical protein Bbelb_269170 [Branchiostoma belcheri]
MNFHDNLTNVIGTGNTKHVNTQDDVSGSHLSRRTCLSVCPPDRCALHVFQWPDPLRSHGLGESHLGNQTTVSSALNLRRRERLGPPTRPQQRFGEGIRGGGQAFKKGRLVAGDRLVDERPSAPRHRPPIGSASSPVGSASSSRRLSIVLPSVRHRPLVRSASSSRRLDIDSRRLGIVLPTARHRPPVGSASSSRPLGIVLPSAQYCLQSARHCPYVGPESSPVGPESSPVVLASSPVDSALSPVVSASSPVVSSPTDVMLRRVTTGSIMSLTTMATQA